MYVILYYFVGVILACKQIKFTSIRMLSLGFKEFCLTFERGYCLRRGKQTMSVDLELKIIVATNSQETIHIITSIG